MKNFISNLMFWLAITLIVLLIALFLWWFNKTRQTERSEQVTSWQFRSIDTMKLSRDPAKEKLNDPTFDEEIEKQMQYIADTGATHVGIASPYDEEFLPFLKRWVVSARKHHLKVWFRGNWSSWEGWFGRDKKMTFEEHMVQSVDFIKKYPELFEDGDAFTACPECENGAQGDPRMTQQVNEYRRFLIDEHTRTSQAFASINKKVNTSLLSMNKDVADLVMDEATAKGVGGFVTIDHYVTDAKQIARDVDELAQKTKAKIVLGEFGAPIPDLNGEMTQDQQAKWIDEALGELLKSDNLYGLSYWVNIGGSTAIWNDDHTPKKAVDVLTKYFTPMQAFGSIVDELGFPVKDVIVLANGKKYRAVEGEYLVPLYGFQTISFQKEGFNSPQIEFKNISDTKRKNVTLSKNNPSGFYSFWANIRRTLISLFNSD